MKAIRCVSFLLAAIMAIALSSCGAVREDVHGAASALQPNGFCTKGKSFHMITDSGSDEIYLCGVNMGLTEATTSLDNVNVSYETYESWFEDIAAMNANTVKVFTVMPPQFYRALKDFNERGEKVLFLMQGIWFNEDYMYSVGDAYGGEIISAFLRAARETVDIVHGNCDYTSYGEIENAVYNSDVSKYTAGFILGLEWDSNFVINTNEHTEKSAYTGEYLKTAKNASPFESFLCEVGDGLIKYQTENYDFQTPTAFLNWATTDTIEHTNEPFPEEDAVSVNTENILPTDKFTAGLFAAVDAYPYYPEFMNYQPEYADFTDPDTGEKNPYRGYLNDLLEEYTVPTVIAEVGLPTSRGCAHTSAVGYNQGGITEDEQGEYVAKMLSDIHAEGYAGAMIFSWQDEWFKQTWNTIKYYPDSAARRTPNVQSAEQSYGILAVEPGDAAAAYCDGDASEWSEEDLVCRADGYALYSKYDEGYLYFYVKPDGEYDFGRENLLIPISTVGLGSKFSKDFDVKFSEKTDFLISVGGREDTRVLTDAYYDLFYQRYSAVIGAPYESSDYGGENSGVYSRINQFLSNEIVLPLTTRQIEPKYYESGLLKFGNNNPDSEDYCSTADFYGGENGVELRIPWYLLNVMNSADKIAASRFESADTTDFTEFSGIKAGIASANSAGKISLSDVGYDGIKTVKYHTRLKKSYEILRDAIAEIYRK